MEFPSLGEHCREKTCNKLDFLPMKCDACKEIFCSEHFSYLKHECPSAHQKDFQVPVCPLCGDPVPTPLGTSPDQTVGEHIDRYCKSETKKIFTNKCSFKNCKKKELIPFKCATCNMNFCLRHRHCCDCSKIGKEKRSLMAEAAEKRTFGYGIFSNRITSNTHAQIVQGNMSEDEALAKALALSITELDESAANRRNQPSISVGGSGPSSIDNKDKCSLS